jgi:hypothetical protein
MMDQYVDPYPLDLDFPTIIYLEEHSKKQTVLLVGTGDGSHLTARVNFKALREGGLCLPLERTDILATSEDVVRVSLTTAVKFITDLQQMEHTTFQNLQPFQKWKRAKTHGWKKYLPRLMRRDLIIILLPGGQSAALKLREWEKTFEEDREPLYRSKRYWR